MLNLDFKDNIVNSGFRRNDPVSANAGAYALKSLAVRLRVEMANDVPGERLARIRREIDGRIAFVTAFGPEDQLLLHLICERRLNIDVIALDTGRLRPEAYVVWAECERRYGIRIRAVCPRRPALERLVARHGVSGIHESESARQACCQIRKLEPLDRALAGAAAWVSGLHEGIGSSRQSATAVEFDDERGLLRVNPLFDQVREELLDEIRRRNVLIHSLPEECCCAVSYRQS